MKKRIIRLLQKNQSQSGFTLIEMVIVVAIVVMLLIIIAPNLINQKDNAQKRTDQAFVSTLQTQVESYNDDHAKDPIKNSLDPLKDEKYLSLDQQRKLDKYMVHNGKVSLKNEQK